MCMCPLPVVPPLIGTILRLLQIRSESKPDDGGEDEQLQTLSEIIAEFLSDICLLISKVFSCNGANSSGPRLRDVTGSLFLNLYVFFLHLFYLFKFVFNDAGSGGGFSEKRLPHREDVTHSCGHFGSQI